MKHISEKGFWISIYVLIAVIIFGVKMFAHRWDPLIPVLVMPAYVFLFAIGGALLIFAITLDGARLGWATYRLSKTNAQVARDERDMKKHAESMKGREQDQQTAPPVKEQLLEANKLDLFIAKRRFHSLTWDVCLIAGLIVIDLYLASIVGASWWASGGYECKFDKKVITAPNSVRYGDHGICSIGPGMRSS